MYEISKKALILVLALFINLSLAVAQKKNFFISKTDPSWIIKIASDTKVTQPKNVSDGYYISMLERQNHAELQESYTHVIREIISDAGVQNGSEISVTYDPSYEKLTFHHITVWRNEHPEDKLDASKFKVHQNETELSKFIYSGTFDAYVILDDIRKGDRIEYSYTIKGQNPILGNQYTSIFYFENSSIISRRYTNLIADQKRKLTFKNFNFDSAPKTSEKNGLKLYEWESRLTKTYTTPKFTPAWYDPLKHTQVSEYHSWSEIVKWGLRVNDYPNLKTPLLDKKAAELQLKANHQTKKYIELAIRFVQDEVRYMGVEMGEYSQRPNSPEKVLQQRYGDCKDKSLLLIYLLNRANVKAYMAYTDTYDGKVLNDFLPSPVIFNHAVVMIEFNHQKKWVDATNTYQRGDFDHIYFPNYGKGLVLKPGVTAPENVVSKATGKLVANLMFYPGDTLGLKKTKLIIKSIYTGNEADDMRSTIADDGTNGVEKSFLDYIGGYYTDTEIGAPIKISDNEQTNTISITESYLIPGFWQNAGKQNSRYYTYFYGDLITNCLRDIATKNRIQPLTQKYPIDIEENVQVRFPDKWDFTTTPLNIKTAYFQFKFEPVISGKIMTLRYSYKSLKDHIEAKDVAQYIKDTEAIKEPLSFGIYWGGKLGNGNFSSAAAALAAAIFVLSAAIFVKIYKQQYEFDLEELAKAKPISGWLIILLIGIPFSIIIIFIQALSSGVYYEHTWTATESFSGIYEILLDSAYFIITIAYPLRITWLIVSYLLLVHRREIFPKIYTSFLIFAVSARIFEFLTTLLANYLSNKQLINVHDFIQLICSIIISTIWVTYLKNSSQVWSTFVFTYPELSWKPDLIKRMNAGKREHRQ